MGTPGSRATGLRTGDSARALLLGPHGHLQRKETWAPPRSKAAVRLGNLLNIAQSYDLSSSLPERELMLYPLSPVSRKPWCKAGRTARHLCGVM